MNNKDKNTENLFFDSEDFSTRLYQLRDARNLSTRALSNKLGHNKNYIGQIESGKFLPSLNEFFEICRALSITPSDFFNTSEKNPGLITEISKLCNKLTSDQQEVIYNMLKEFVL